ARRRAGHGEGVLGTMAHVVRIDGVVVDLVSSRASLGRNQIGCGSSGDEDQSQCFVEAGEKWMAAFAWAKPPVASPRDDWTASHAVSASGAAGRAGERANGVGDELNCVLFLS